MLHKKKDNLFSLVTTLTTKLGFSFLRMTTLRAKLVIESIAMRNVLLGRRRYHVRIGRIRIGRIRIRIRSSRLLISRRLYCLLLLVARIRISTVRTASLSSRLLLFPVSLLLMRVII
jgi:hypothetical protein